MKKLPLCLAIAGLTASTGYVPVFAQQTQEIEEIVVTGSFIKRDGFDSAVPLTVVGSEEIEANATPNLGEVLANQTFNYGTDTQTNTYAARSQGGNNSQANLRGLGANATLNLFDGKRTDNTNLNNALPQIAIQRIDIVKDGASALYGTDAVAGVVNIIPNKSFEGAKFNFLRKQTDDSALEENQYEFMTGSSTDNGHFVMAIGYSERGELQQVERPNFLRNGFERSGTGNPGDWTAYDRWSDVYADDTNAAYRGALASGVTLAPGQLLLPSHLSTVEDLDTNGDGVIDSDDSSPSERYTAALRKADPGCGAFNGSGTDVGIKNNYRSGDRTATNCRLHFGEFWNYINPQDKFNLWSNFSFDFSDDVTNEIDFMFSRLSTESRGSPQNPGGRTEEFPIVPGTHPGNPFRAYSDTDGDGIVDPGERLFAQDLNGDGIPDRGATDANGDGLPDVLLAPLPFVSAADDPVNGGIPFYEDVDVVALRIFGKLGTKPTAFNSDGSNTGSVTFDSTNYRISDTLTWTVPDSSWEVTGGVIYQRNFLEDNDKNTSQNNLVAGLNGTLIADPTNPNTSTWNPFSTQELYCQNRVCAISPAGFNPDDGEIRFYNNSQDVVDAINIQALSTTDSTFYSYDLLAVGDLFDLPTGDTVGLAVGYQYRNEKRDVDLDDSRNRCDWHEGGCGFDYKAQLDVRSAFFETRFPLSDTALGDYLEFTVAGRYTDYGGAIGDSVDPKISFLYQPISDVSFRGSYSTAFIAPTLIQLFTPTTCGLQTASDELTGDVSQSFRVACNQGNSGLEPETADVFNIGVSGQLLDGDLTLGLDYSVYDFKDRIAASTLNQVVAADFAAYQAANGGASAPTGSPGSVPSVAAWIASGNSDPAIQRDSTGVITRVDLSRFNAQEMKHVAYDLYSRYNIDTNDFGSFTLGLNATFVDEYSFDLGNGTSGDGAGRQNEEVVEVPPMPEWTVNGNVSWFFEGHSAGMRVRWNDGYIMSFNSAALQRAQAGVNGTLEQDAIMYVDLNYAYNFNFWGDRETRLEVGIQNVADEYPDPIFNLGGIETFVHSIRGREYVLRLVQDI